MIHDLVGIGLGPSNIGLAVAISGKEDFKNLAILNLPPWMVSHHPKNASTRFLSQGRRKHQ